jgi:peptidoglycan/LPS O-acetylase OafA/YrhL
MAKYGITPKPKARYEYLDGIRGLASLAVFNLHFTSAFPLLVSPSPLFAMFFTEGKLAVHIFFVLV